MGKRWYQPLPNPSNKLSNRQVSMSEADQNILVMEGISKAFPVCRRLMMSDFIIEEGRNSLFGGGKRRGKVHLDESADRGRSAGFGHDHPGWKRNSRAKSPQHAQALGISTVYQEINLCMNLSVAENILLGREPHKWAGSIWRR